MEVQTTTTTFDHPIDSQVYVSPDIQRLADSVALSSTPLWNDGVRISRYEKWVRVVILTPMFLAAIATQVGGSGQFPAALRSLASSAWTVRNCISAVGLVPLILKIKRGEGIGRDKKLESTENISQLVAKIAGLILLGSNLTSIDLGKVGAYVIGLGLIVKATHATALVSRRVSETPKSRETVIAALEWGFFAGGLLETTKLNAFATYINPLAASWGLVNSGFGIVHSGFGTAAAIASLALTR